MPIIILSDEDRDAIVDLLRWNQWERRADLVEKAPSNHTIRIIVSGGVVEHVERLPMGFDYEVQDFDNCSECGEVEPLCDWCRTKEE